MARSTTSRQASGGGRPNPRTLGLGGGRGRFGFVREVYAELRKSVWPSREEATRLTTLVIVISIAVGVGLALIDYIFSLLFRVIAA